MNLSDQPGQDPIALPISVTQKTKNRVAWIDNLRSIGIFAVVLVHTGRLEPGFAIYAASFFMPLFFFISGLFVKDKVIKQPFFSFAQVRAYKLLIPYITFNIISYVLWFFVLRHVGGRAEEAVPPLKPLLGMVYGVGGNDWLAHNITLWFFTCLFSTEIFFFFLLKLKDKTKIAIALFSCSIVGYLFFAIVGPANFRLPFGLDIGLTAIVFYGLGYLLQSYVLKEKFSHRYFWPVTIILLGVYVGCTRLNGSTAFIIGNFGNYFYFYLSAIAGILFWMHVAYLIKPNWLLSAIGQNTLIIFPLHLLVFPFLTGFLVYGLRIPPTTLAQSNLIAFAYAVVAILLLLPVGWLLTTYAPVFIGRPSRAKAAQP
ncbi:acyltransferase family protein [Almyronema epifaneia]|uniref:Acyltransferase family protein n=1 Tax=Almyronema epifaneia S1 TaxID=2991925 RepID=A0ABW6IF26_9CYAN